MTIAETSEWRLRIDERICLLETPYDKELVAAIRAIPGRLWDRSAARWSVYLTPDRAWSLLRLVESFPQLGSDQGGVDELERQAGPRSTDRYDLELVMPVREGPACLSLCDDWHDRELERLIAEHESLHHSHAGRVSVVLDQSSARAVHELAVRRKTDMRLSRRLGERIELLTDGTPAGAIPDRRIDTTTSVRFRAGPRTHRHELLITTPRADAYMDGLPSTTRVGREAVVAPAEPRVAVALTKLLDDDRDAIVASAVRDWLRVATRWMGRVTATEIGDRPTWVVIGNGAPLPAAVRERLGDVPESGTWRVPLDADGRDMLLALVAAEPLTRLDEQAQRCLDWVERHPGVDPPAAVVTMREGENGEPEFAIDELWGHGLADRFGGLPGARDTRGAPGGHVSVVADAWAPDAVDAFVSEWAVAPDDEARGVLDGLLEEHRAAEELVELSLATDGSIDVPKLEGELMPFQAAGIEYALKRRRSFIADEQGLGKTVQALATVELAGAYPAIVACPASLKLNWKREAARWLPHRRVAVITGKRAVDTKGADFVVINYDILGAHRERLAGLAPGALVLDESHYCKNPSAQRTKETLELAKALPKDALRLALTGTPLVNRPKELVPQLRILGRLREFGSGSELERRFGATGERERLHWHLRRTCYVRRLKKDVLPQLPAKRRAVVPFDIDNQREYRQAERNLVEWLQERFSSTDELHSRVDSALRAEALVRVNALRQLVAAGKLSSAVGWIEDFLASGEKLVVFAAHRAIQKGLVERFPDAPHILGSDTLPERDAAVQRFQTSPDARLCICSLKVAAHGFTLTAAANAAFLELGWTPAEHDQAEDRCHRIGQTDSVTAWYLLAAETIDERMATLIDAKREVVGAVTDGRPASEASMIDGLLADYLKR